MKTRNLVRPHSLSAVQGSLLRASIVLRVASFAATGAGLSACVPAKHYDEARTAAESEVSAHGRTRARLEAAHQRILAIEAELQQREQAIVAGESTVAQSKFETTVATKEKEAAMVLVDQLRSELARTGSHLVVFTDEKRDLERALVLAEQRLSSIESAEKTLSELVAAARDLALALGETVLRSGFELGARDGQIVLVMPATKLFATGTDALVVEAAPVLAAVGKVSAAHPTLRVIVREPAGAPVAEARALSLGAALRERGVAENRLVLPTRTARAPQAAIEPVASAEVPSADTATAPGSEAPAQTPVPAAPAAPMDEASLRYEIAFAP